MKFLTALLITASLATTVAAKEIVVNREYLAEQSYRIALDMPCDWDGEVANTTIFGYYGEDQAQNHIAPVSMTKFGDNLLLELSPDIATFGDKPLRHIAVEFPETRTRCKTGATMDLLTK